MACFDNYITLESSTPSRSGLYATDLPGIDSRVLDGIARNVDDTPDEDHEDIWPIIYKRAHRNLVSDTQKQLQAKFHTNLKLVTRETSAYKEDYNSGSGLAGVSIEFKLPKYARTHVLSIQVFSAQAYASAGIFKIYDTDEDGELLDTITTAISQGRNTINVDTDYEADKIFIAYDSAVYSFKQTENKYYADSAYNEFGPVTCDESLYGDEDFNALVVQENGGGVNGKFIIHCSIEKYVCENLKLFEDALLYRIGLEITVERRLTERLDKYVVMTQERWDELKNFYEAQYKTNLMNTIDGGNIMEDEYCFACRNTVRTETILP